MRSAGGYILKLDSFPLASVIMLSSHSGVRVQCQIRLPAPVVLNISAKNVLAEIAGCKRAGDSALKFARYVGQKILYVAKEPDSIGSVSAVT